MNDRNFGLTMGNIYLREFVQSVHKEIPSADYKLHNWRNIKTCMLGTSFRLFEEVLTRIPVNTEPAKGTHNIAMIGFCGLHIFTFARCSLGSARTVVCVRTFVDQYTDDMCIEASKLGAAGIVEGPFMRHVAFDEIQESGRAKFLSDVDDLVMKIRSIAFLIQLSS